MWCVVPWYPFITLHGLTHWETIIFSAERNISHIQTTFKNLLPTAQEIICLTFKHQIVNDAYGNNRYLLWEFYDTYKCIEWALITKVLCTYVDYGAWFFWTFYKYFFLSPSIIAICPRTFKNRAWPSLLMACRKYIQWCISYIKLNHIDWVWFFIHEVF